MPAREARVLVSVVHWNSPELTARCLAALARQDDLNFEVCVVDNASRRGARAAIEQALPDATLLTLAENMGFAAGHAHALSHAMARGCGALWLLNSDAEPDSDALRRLREAWREHGDALYGSALIEGPAGAERLQLPGKFLATDGRWRYGRRDPVIPYEQPLRDRPAFPVAAVGGASMLIPMTIVQRHGFLDTGFFMYCEETDYCLRLASRGVRSWLVPRSRVRHIGGGSHRDQAAVANLLCYYRTRNEIELWRRHGGPWFVWIVVRKALRAALAGILDRGRGWYRWRGLLDGVRRRLGKTIAPESAWRPR